MKLEVDVNADAKGVVFTLENVCLRTCSSLCGDLAILVESAHIAEVEAEFLGCVDTNASTNHVVRKVEREVVHELIIHAVTSCLPRT